ncbi:MAG: nucleotidyltransferase domain-containing protein [Muribaculaceae bacterium]|nr:nucleotidyltransferase domain-containing protein [Muribaculaceae bacterium]
MNDTGLSDEDIAKLTDAIRQCEKVDEIILYGSRAKGNFKKFSDIDLTLKGKGLTRKDLFPMLEWIDDLYLPYEIDLSIYSELDYQPLIDEIDMYGIKLG